MKEKMRNTMRRLLGIITAVAMLLTLSGISAVPAKAAETVTVTINPAPSNQSGESGYNSNRNTSATGYPSYEYYAMMWASVGTDNKVSYYVDKEQLAYALDQLTVTVDGTAKDLFTVTPTPTSTGTTTGHWNVVVNHKTEASGETAATEFTGEEVANALNSITNKGTLAEAHGTVAKDANPRTFTLTDNAYVLVVSSLGTKLVADTVQTKTIVEKNVYPTSDKKQSETSGGTYTDDPLSAEIGDTIYYHIDITIPQTANKAVKVVDIISKGLTMNTALSYTTTHNSTATSLTWDNNNPTAAANGDKTFTVTIPEATIKNLASQMVANNVSSTILTVSYSAVVNADAATIDPDTNKAHIEYDNYVYPDDEVDVYTYKFNVLKYDAADSSKAQLAGATFQLLKGDNKTVVNLVPIDNETVNHYQYRVAGSGEQNTVTSFTTFDTVASHNIEIFGLDKDTTYYLRETVAPDGYNRLTSDVQVNYDSDTTSSLTKLGGTGENGTPTVVNPVIEIANHQGSVLPSTGGIGTTIFYVIGGVLVAGAIVLLAVRRRRNA